MSGVKLDIIWSPIHSNRFITVGSDIHLYQIEEGSSPKSSSILISDSEYASVLSVNSDYTYLKCVAWYPKCTSDLLLAVGLASGNVVITGFGQYSQDSQRLIGREFAPKQHRPCNGIAWNQTESHLLACGLEKNRSDSSLIVWDINRPPLSQSGNSTSQLTSPYETITAASGISGADIVNSFSRTQNVRSAYPAYSDLTGRPMMNKPVVEYCYNETVHSVQWFMNQPKALVLGNNNKYLRIFDLRDSALKPHNTTQTKAVFGVCTDPFFEHRLASFVDNQIYIWDTRNFEKAVLMLTEPKQVAKLSWCPTRENLVSSLTRDSSVVNLYDIQSMDTAVEEIEPTIIDRRIQPQNNQSVVLSFSWHPTQENSLLSISPAGNICKVAIADRISVAWLPSTQLLWSNGKNVVVGSDQIDNLEDISITMRQRAMKGYGDKLEQVWPNSQLTHHPKLVNLWKWIDSVKNMGSEEPKMKWPAWYHGVHSLICNGENNMNSELVCVQWIGVDGPMLSPSAQMYKSSRRDLAFQLCGWGNNRDDTSFNLFLERLVAEGEFERAATIAVFNLRIREAIKILDRGSSVRKNASGLNLNIVAMALSGYTEQKTLWREMCDSQRTKLGNAYLSGMFAFLTADSYVDILNESGMTVSDRVAFACLYLSDSDLTEYIESITAMLVKTGDLDGILLTGFHESGMDLLQKYVDNSGDVQTASLIMLQTLSIEPIKDPRATRWISNYYDLLDQWRLWHQRAIFDVHYHKHDTSSRPSQQVSASCNFCGKSISAHINAMSQARVRPLVGLHGPTANRNKICCCPGCRKPLPRCSLCLINMGTPSGLSKPKKTNCDEGDKDQVRSRFSNWFTWCQSCRHGGHAIHINEWFKMHKECPVTGCSCKCFSLDVVSNQTNLI